MFTITRLFSDSNGDSRFEDLEIPLSDKGEIGFLSISIPVDSIQFRMVPADYDYNFHTAPQRQYIILLEGEIEIQTSLGEKRQFSGGEILLVEDTEGKGHKTRNLQPVKRKSIFITLPESTDRSNSV